MKTATHVTITTTRSSISTNQGKTGAGGLGGPGQTRAKSKANAMAVKRVMTANDAINVIGISYAPAEGGLLGPV